MAAWTGMNRLPRQGAAGGGVLLGPPSPGSAAVRWILRWPPGAASANSRRGPAPDRRRARRLRRWV